MSATKSVLLTGVGGQGILLASNILARAAQIAGHDVKTNEVHGMAQRGGSVVAEIRYGGQVRSPLIEPGTCIAIAALEQVEALRWAHYMAPGGIAVVSKLKLIPTTVSMGSARYPDNMEERLKHSFPVLKYIDAAGAAAQAGNEKANNVVVLGCLSCALDFPEPVWQQAMEQCIRPKFLDLNLQAFRLGRQMFT